jgi:hypothetical protein
LEFGFKKRFTEGTEVSQRTQRRDFSDIEKEQEN